MKGAEVELYGPVKAFLEIERAWSKTPRPLLRRY